MQKTLMFAFLHLHRMQVQASASIIRFGLNYVPIRPLSSAIHVPLRFLKTQKQRSAR